MLDCALIDTSFLIRFLNEKDELHDRAVEYFKYFLDHDIMLRISTIAIAEFCVKGNITSLPMKKMLPLPFNVGHAIRAGKLISIVYEEKKKRGAQVYPRMVIPNDTKMFAQADFENDIKYFVSADSEAVKVYDIIKNATDLHFEFIDIRNVSCADKFRFFDFKDV